MINDADEVSNVVSNNHVATDLSPCCHNAEAADHLPDQFIIAEVTKYYTCQDK